MMKKHSIILSLITIAIALLSGCNKMLDIQPSNQITSATVWEDVNLMQAYVNEMYRTIGLGEFNSTSGLSVTGDEAMWTNGATPIIQSTITSSNLDILGGARFNFLVWGDLYAAIRKCNDFLENTDEFMVSDHETVQRLRGEAYFLRGYYYQNLLRMNGGVPLITQVYGLEDSTAIARGSFEETVNFIVRDADSAAALLPTSHDAANLGRATKGAAMALKARILLHAASDLYNVNPSGMPETGYVGASTADRQARWTAARDAAKAVMDLNLYQLYMANPAPGDSTAANYANLFLMKNSEEVIMNRFTSVENGATQVGIWFHPNGYHGYGENSPIQAQVDAYRMADGSEFDWNNPEHAAHPYENRDPRFYATVFYDGAHWKPRTPDGEIYDPVGIIQTFNTLILPNGTTLPGIDTRNGPIEDWNGSYPNYYLRKFLDPTNQHMANAQEVPWPVFRYAEILLIYAEANAELGQDQQAKDALNQIRRRAGMPEFPASLTGAALKKELRNERRIELAFEDHRFWDIRRWMIAPDVMNQNAQGIDITVHGTDRADRSTYHDYTYKVVDVQDRHWDDKMYFMPIQLEEMNRNPLLVQNPGY